MHLLSSSLTCSNHVKHITIRNNKLLYIFDLCGLLLWSSFVLEESA